MSILNKQEIINIKDIYFEEINVPEWNGSVRIYMLNAGERLDFENTVSAGKQKSGLTFDANLLVTLVSLCLKDENGAPIFEIDEIDELRKKNFRVIKRLADKCMEINALGEDAEQESKKN